MSASSDAPSETPASASAPGRLGDDDLDQAVTRVEQELGRLFARIRIGWREAAATVHPDLQPLGYQVLTSIATGKANLGRRDHRTAADRQVGGEPPGATARAAGTLVESVPDPEDRRARVLVATELAQERVALARSRYEGRIGERLRNWTAADLDHFADLLAGLGG